MHKQIQIAPGVYITDFRKDKNIVGLTEQKKQLTNDLGLLLDQVNELQQKIKQLIFSIQQIKNEPDWQSDSDFKQAIEQNWGCIMKQKVIRLFQLNYQPQSEKIQELLKISRIEDRENVAIQELKKIILRTNKELEEKRLVEVDEEEDDSDRNLKGKGKGKEKEKEKEKGRKESQQNEQSKKQGEGEEDKGVYV